MRNMCGWMGERCFLKMISCGFVYGRMRQEGDEEVGRLFLIAPYISLGLSVLLFIAASCSPSSEPPCTKEWLHGFFMHRGSLSRALRRVSGRCCPSLP